MHGFLVPIRAFTSHALGAVRFAVEFGKRNNGILYFLFVDDPEGAPVFRGEGNFPGPGRKESLVQRQIEALIAVGESIEGLQMETHYRSGEFMQEIQKFVGEHYITEIVVSLPDEAEEAFEQTRKDILLLLKMTNCRVLTVKQKQKGSR